MAGKKRKDGPQTIGFVGDIHCGSHVGLWPLDDLPAGKFIGCRYLHGQFSEMVQSWPELDLLVLMGDLIDGKQQKSSGVGVFTTDLGEQAEAAVTILKPLAKKAKRIMRVWGTPYHESYDSILKIVDKSLNVEHVEQVIDLELPTGTLNLAHHPASGTALYQGTVVDREALWSQLAAYERKVPDARWIVRAHKHNFFLQETQNRTIVILPAWQLPTAWAVKVNYWRFQPSLGGVLMVADQQHHSGYRFVPYLYEMPIKEVLQWRK